MMKKICYGVAITVALTLGACTGNVQAPSCLQQPVDYVNPYMGNISHLLVPTYPTVHLPNSLLRVYPVRSDHTGELLHGLPVVVPAHRRGSVFSISPYQGEQLQPVADYSYDNEKITPYYYEVTLDDRQQTQVKFAPSHQSAIYQIAYGQTDKPAYLMINARNGRIKVGENSVSGYENLKNNTRVYLYLETDAKPQEAGILKGGKLDTGSSEAEGHDACAVLRFADTTRKVGIRYGVSLISEEQARLNLKRELADYDVQALADKGRAIWNSALGSICVQGGTDDDKKVLYTSLYRVYERPVCISEDGRYFSAYDGKVHEDNGTPFYTDDWLWDTYRAAHPLRILLDQRTEEHILSSYITMTEQMERQWMPTFPGVDGDSRGMNSNHGTASVADACAKGLKIDYEKAYIACKKAIEEKTLAPWSAAPSGWIDRFYKEHGYIPALKEGETETDPNVHPFESRQPIAVTLGTAYDQWCLSEIASALGKEEEAAYYLKCSYNYRNIFHPKTGFFHPKDKDGRWIEPFDYRFSGGQGARQYYDENNGWVYRWDVPHNIPDLIRLMGGDQKFVANLDQMFSEPLGKSKYVFYNQLPDHTGNVGQFSMANEPSLHIPYLYNYAGEPWKTQKRIRQLLKTWFRNDLMGVPGDEDGGGMSAFVVFSSLGFYPVTPGMATYNIGSPLFENASIRLSNGKVFEIEARGASAENKYIQSATLNGKEWNQPWFRHDDIRNGGKLVLVMGNTPNKEWGADAAPR